MFELYSVPSHQHGMPEVVLGNQIGSNKRTVEQDTVLLCKINPRINRVWIVGSYSEHAKIASTEWLPFFPLSGLDPRYLAYYLRQNIIRDYLASNASGVGGSLMRVRAATFKELKFRVAPMIEQTRIAEALDELFSDLDAGVAALERARDRLNIYRASVLKAAVEGTLTADWRVAHPHAEPASELLKRVLAERRRRWEEEQLRKFAEKRKVPPKNWRARYKEPVSPDTADLPSLPEGWVVTSMDAVTSRITSGSRDWRRYYGEGSGTFIMAQNVSPGQYNPAFRQAVNPPPEDPSCERSLVQIDDLLVTIVGANTGDVCRIRLPLVDHYVCQSVALMRPTHRTLSSFLDVYCNSPSGAQFHYNRYLYGAGRPHLSFDQLRMTPVVLPPEAEQHAIVNTVDDMLSSIDHIGANIRTKLKSVQRLRQAILRYAFTGSLVPQDPNDEPASELLKRIANEREARARDAAATRRTAKIKTGGRASRRDRRRKTVVEAAR
ncbi:MAG: restriction endonuclease subunit S [Chloroflexota bacterium]|nr:restriction endonuclease subunit S [Chloroflexota bacterium]